MKRWKTECGTNVYSLVRQQTFKESSVFNTSIFSYIYDTKRIVQILGEDGSTTEATIDPDQEEAYNEETGTYNIHAGKYAVIVDVGPSYATRRQEAEEQWE